MAMRELKYLGYTVKVGKTRARGWHAQVTSPKNVLLMAGVFDMDTPEEAFFYAGLFINGHRTKELNTPKPLDELLTEEENTK